MSDFDQGCRQKAWAVGAGAGLVVALFVMAVGHQGVMAGLFLGVITFLLFGGFLVWAFCSGSDIGLAPPKVRQPVATPAPMPLAQPVAAETPAEVVEPVAAPVVSPAAAPAATEASPAPAALMSAPLPAEPAAEAPAEAQAKVKKPAKAKAEKPAKAAKPAKAKSAEAAAKPAKEPKARKAAADGKPKGLKAPRKGGADDLKLIEGIGPKLEEKLNDWGIYHFDQIAAWGAAEVAYADANVPRFKGRCSRDRWVAQAKIIVDEGLERFLERAKTNDY